MTLNLRCKWTSLRPCTVPLVGFIIIILNCISGISLTSPSPCDGVKCPSPTCYANPYLHPCCKSQAICPCYDNSSHSFHSLGERWVSNNCQVCKCETRLQISQNRMIYLNACTKLRCPTSRGCRPGYEKCCPQCRKSTNCYSKELKKQFKDGERWNVTACKHCFCKSGRTHCTVRDCAHVTCPGGETPKALPHQCCRTYCRNDDNIKPYESCRGFHDNRTYSHGEHIFPRWPCSRYTCICRHSDWECHQEKCPLTTCSVNKTMQFGNGKCCTLCAGKKSCTSGKSVLQAGDMWIEKASRKQCGCVDGTVACLLSSGLKGNPSYDQPNNHHTNSSENGMNKFTLPLIIALLVVLLLISIGLAFFFCRRHESRQRMFQPMQLKWKRPPIAGTSLNNSDKVTPTSIYYPKRDADDEMLVQVDENANQQVDIMMS